MEFSNSNRDNHFGSAHSRTIVIKKSDGEKFGLNIEINDNVISIYADDPSEISTQSNAGDVDIIISDESDGDE